MRPPRYVGMNVTHFRMATDGTLIRIEPPDSGPLGDALRTAQDEVRAAERRGDKARKKRAQAALAHATAEAYAPDRLAHLRVTVAVFQDDGGGLVCGNVIVETVPLATRGPEFEDRAPVPVTAGLWRQLRIGELVDEALESTRSLAVTLASQFPWDLVRGDPELETSFGIYADIAGREQKRTRPRPGPKSILTPALLREVVAPAYAAGGRRALQSVQRALQEAGYPGSGPSFDVTNDQARAAVRKARELNLIPPAKRKET